MSKTIKIPGRIESVATGKVVTGANFILDDTKGKKQNVINEETDAELLRLDQEKQGNLTFDQTPTENSTNPVTSGGVYAADQMLSQAIEAILLLIPSAASELNKLVDLATMNSSISTATASFKGTYNLVSDLHLTVSATHAQIAAALDALSLGADNNDYAFVQVPNTDTAPTDIAKTERYKFNGENWAYEYDLNNSGFTTAQWNAINSGITTLLVAKLSALPTNEALTLALSGKQDNLTFDNAPTAGSNNPVKSGGIYTRNNEIVALINALDAAKQDVLTFDTTPTNGSTNPVTSNGVYLAIQLVQTAVVALDGRMGTAETKISTAEGNIANLQAAYAALTQSDIVVVSGALPSSGQQQNIIYRQPDQDHTPPQFYSDYMWNGTTWVLMATYNNAIDPRPKKGSQNLVTSGGVFDNMGALDLSELNATENPHTLKPYATLDAALADIPSDYQKGGMSIKYVQTSDNKYVQFRYMLQYENTTAGNTAFVNTANWQGVDEKPVSKSHNLVESGGVSPIDYRTTEISKTEILDGSESINILDNEDNSILNISPSGVDAKNLKSNSKDVLTEDDMGNLATKQDVEQLQGELEPISENIDEQTTLDSTQSVEIINSSNETVASITEEGADFKELKCGGKKVITDEFIKEGESSSTGGDTQEWRSDDLSEKYAEVSQDGMKAKDFFYLNNNKLINHRLRVSKANNSRKVLVTRKLSSTEDIRIVIEPCGVNQLVQIHQFFYVPNTSDSLSLNSVSTDKNVLSYSDWVGPYYVRAVNNGNDNPPAFTGGYHGYNGDQTGSATARTVSMALIVDGIPVDSANEVLCDTVEIVVENLIQGYNTKVQDGSGREILKETVRYKFAEDKIFVSVDIQPLEDIAISLYYGLQCDWTGNYNILTATKSKNGSISTPYTNTDKSSEVVINKENYCKCIAHLFEEGLGKQELASNNRYTFISNRKYYYDLVGNAELLLSGSDIAYWRGFYSFIN